MRTKQVGIYQFSELSDEAKDVARQWYASGGYSWSGETMDSIKALAAHFDGEMKNWEIDFAGCSHSSAAFHMPEMSKREIAARLKLLGTYDRRTGKGHGDCKLTGYGADEAAIDGFRIAFRKGETDLVALMDAAFDTWLKSAQDDFEWLCKDEALAEHCEANGYEFNEDGTRA